jgi:hypothetical protein
MDVFSTNSQYPNSRPMTTDIAVKEHGKSTEMYDSSWHSSASDRQYSLRNSLTSTARPHNASCSCACNSRAFLSWRTAIFTYKPYSSLWTFISEHNYVWALNTFPLLLQVHITCFQTYVLRCVGQRKSCHNLRGGAIRCFVKWTFLKQSSLKNIFWISTIRCVLQHAGVWEVGCIAQSSHKVSFISRSN